jgi:histidinol dehydrogenase
LARGNIFVATAKQQVFGQVAIDMVAGPSEIGIIADGNANPDEVASDLLSQAEHDRRARAMLVTDSVELAEAVSAAVDQQLKNLPRQEIAQEAIANRSFIAVMADQDEMIELMNSIAPEHLELQVQDPITAMGKVQNAGSVFLGRYASEPLGDYLAGPNHVLPTGGTARFASPLGVYDFVKRTQFLQYTEAALAGVVQEVADLARAEGLEAHARAVEARF